MYTVLLVDDEPLVVKGLRIIIEKSAMPISSIWEVDNGDTALSLIEKKAPDIVITDIRMPRMDGLELCERIHSRFPKTSIIIVSGYDDFGYAQKAMSYNVREYLLKPVRRIELVDSMTRVIKEKDKDNRLPYIAYSELEMVVDILETGLWHNRLEGIRQGIDKLHGLFKDVPIAYCKNITADIYKMLLYKLTVKIGYTMNRQLLHYDNEDIGGFSIWLEEVFTGLLNELNERKENSDFHLFEMAKEYIRNNYDSNITLEELAHKMGFSPSYFSQLFKIKTGKSFVQYKNEIRLNKAKEMLFQSGKSITEVAIDVGYNDLTYFIRVFKNFTGLTPNEYKRKQCENP